MTSGRLGHYRLLTWLLFIRFHAAELGLTPCIGVGLTRVVILIMTFNQVAL